MFQSPQNEFRIASGYKALSRAIWIGSKVAESVGIEVEQQADVYSNMWRRLIEEGYSNPSPAQTQADHLAAKLVALVTLVEQTAAAAGPKTALATIMRESGKAIDPLLAKSFLRLASSPVFWLALDSVGEVHSD